MTTVVVDPRLRCSRHFLFARAEARWRFRLAMTLFCLAMTVTLRSPSERDWPKREPDTMAAEATAHLLEAPHCDLREKPDQHVGAPNQMLEWSISNDDDAARGARAADAERFRSEAGRGGADCMIFDDKDVSP
ncbi:MULTISPECIES: hypothetical protein [Methylosinus]|uniref:Uncharacterized protein n=1 Tax=Methylosinus trichosporium (strain ATCC 35070 / NCIMB 11131 / UNIQEM 75 / OB3b) TaxID=595536 RepID=A0A2D2CZH8_METT3|nr:MULTISPECIES: hypothetical protein [Methylosinus]ATQ68116.1 hypothetical protein CQW49_09640 [Methylosinus trichosporium OB3b]OBS53503.1 hypothetical protein A8B73_05460 [Methylosinus sp. 3S-1]